MSAGQAGRHKAARQANQGEKIVEGRTVEILGSEIERIKKIAPFDRFTANALEAIIGEASLVFFKHGQAICHPEFTEPAQGLWLVRQGAVQRSSVDTGAAMAEPRALLETGALFPLECALDSARAEDVYLAHEDTFAWRLSGAPLDRMLSKPTFLRWLAEQWRMDTLRLRESTIGLTRSRQVADLALSLPAISAGTTKVTCTAPDTPIGEAARLFSEKGIGSLLIGTPAEVQGIVTQSDLVRRGLASDLSHDAPVSTIMTTNPASIDDHASVLEAGIEMARHGFRHLWIRDPEGKLAGIVSERDLFRIQQQGIVHVFKPINEAASVEAMVEISTRVRELTERVFRQGMEVGQFMRLVSSINDRIAQRLITLIAGEAAKDQFCWLAFGSEGREEQGFVTDQDNGICFAPCAASSGEGQREHYLAIAHQINEALHACGFDRCKGNIMAGNPEWCLSLDEWKHKFSNWIKAPTPTALLNATIFFDFRPIFGNFEFAEDLRDHLLTEARGNSLFLSMLARNALEVAPPVGRISRFSTGRGVHKGTIDLKTQGSRLFVDIARIYSLAHGVRTSNTEQRLRIAGQRAKRAATMIEGDVAALRFIQRIRLKRQLDSLGDKGDPNRIDPYLINEVEQRILRESFLQAQLLQERLRMDYQR
jgi:CBS domain-containing protein